MDVSEQEVVDFQDAYELDFGEEISADAAREMLARLVQFFEIIGRPLPGQKRPPCLLTDAHTMPPGATDSRSEPEAT